MFVEIAFYTWILICFDQNPENHDEKIAETAST
jgi:hypothetical protein